MGRIRGEFIRLGEGASYAGGGWGNLIDSIYGMFSIETGEIGTSGITRPVVPSFGAWQRGHVRLIVDVPTIVVTGPNPIASPNSPTGFLLLSDVPEVFPVLSGDRLSFVTVANY